MNDELETTSKGSSLGLIGVLSQHLLGGTQKKPREASVMACCVPAMTRTAYLLNTSLEWFLLLVEMSSRNLQFCERRRTTAVSHSACKTMISIDKMALLVPRVFFSSSCKCEGWSEAAPLCSDARSQDAAARIAREASHHAYTPTT
jgi:hypothetical protein